MTRRHRMGGLTQGELKEFIRLMQKNEFKANSNG